MKREGYYTVFSIGSGEPAAGTPIPPRDTEYEAWLDAIAADPKPTPAKKQPRQYGTAADLSKPIDPRIFNLRPRHRAASCNHGGGQS